MDFTKKLPSSFRFDTILAIVNQLTKKAIFISVYDTIISVDLTCLFILHVFSKYSIPFHVISDKSLELVFNFFYFLGTCHMQAHLSGSYISTVISFPNYTSPPSMVAIFLTTCFMAVLQPSGYSVFYDRDTPIQLSLL